MAHRSPQISTDRESQLLDFIGSLYDAALAPEELPRVLSQLSELCGGR